MISASFIILFKKKKINIKSTLIKVFFNDTFWLHHILASSSYKNYLYSIFIRLCARV